MKVKLIQALYRNDITAIFHAFKNSDNYLLLHDTLIEQCSFEKQYLYVKAFKLASPSLFDDFAAATTESKHGYKKLFFNVLEFYDTSSYNLQYCHKEEEGKQPELTIYANIARTILA